MTEDFSTLGRIITFYSYKGGTGRSMALANAACWLAKNSSIISQKVLVMDWDLEAPGLHRFFAEQTELLENRERPGVINYFDSLQNMLSADQSLLTKLISEGEPEVLDDLLSIDDFIIREVVPGVDLFKAGMLDVKYAELISRFNWVSFYNEYGAVIELFRNLLVSKYAYVLIDSRTGFTDISGICTMLLPEKLVTVFTPNRQSLSGVLDLTNRATQYRRSSNDFRPLSVFPLPSRIETAEQDLKREWRIQYQQEFEAVFRNVYQLEECDLTAYFDEVQLPHVGFYSYGENIALLKERGDSLSLGRAYEVFFERLIDFDFPWEKVSEVEFTLPAPVVINVEGQEPNTSINYINLESDIFISYAHVDNSPLAEGLSGWVDELHERLATRLAQLLGKPPKIWRDRKLAGSDVFNDVVAIELSKTTLLLTVLSPRYVQSTSCLSELESFFRLADQGGGIRVGEKHHVFKVVKTYVAPEEHPPQLRDLLGYEFFQIDRVTGRVREFDHEINSRGERDRRYWDKFEDLVWDIKESITRLENRQPDQPYSLSPSAATIYLAETTSDLSEERDKVKRELQQFGHVVLPDKALPLNAPALQEAVREYLKCSRLSVHLIGEHYGLIPEMELERSVVRLQQELAMERNDNGEFSSLIWMPPGLTPKDERQSKFIIDLQSAITARSEVELLQTKVEDLKTIIQARLTQKPKPVVSASGGMVRIYLICDRQDVDAVEPLQNDLLDRGYEVMLPLLDGSEAEVLQDHKEILLLCDAVLIFQGRASEGWLRMKLRELLKLPGYGRTSPLLGKAVYVSAPESQPKERFKTHEALVIKNYGEFDPSSLDSFLAQISKAKGALQ